MSREQKENTASGSGVISQELRYSNNFTRMMLKILLVSTLVAGVVLTVFFYFQTRSFAISQARDKINALLEQQKSINDYITHHQKPAIYKLKKGEKLYEEYFSPELLSGSYIIRNVHDYYNKYRVKSHKEELYYKLAAINPRNPLNEPDEFERELIEKFNQTDDEKYTDVINIGGTQYLYYAIPFMPNTDTCMNCHGDPAAAPRELVERYGNEAGFYEEPGQIRAITSIRVPLESELAEARSIFWVLGLTTFLVLFLIFVLGGTRLVRYFTKQSELLTQKRFESEALFRVTFEQAAVGIAHIDLDGNIIRANGKFCDILNYNDSDEIVNVPVSDLVCSDDSDLDKTASHKLYEGLINTYSIERRYIQKDSGAAVWVNETNSLSRDENGDPLFIIKVIDDITSRKNTEKQLRDNNAKMIDMANQMRVIMQNIDTCNENLIYFKNLDIVKCHEEKSCDRSYCPAYNTSEALRCWEIAGTFCEGEVQGKFAKKINDCRKCSVYQKAHEDSVSNLGESFNEIMLLLESNRSTLEEALKETKQAKANAEMANTAKSQFLANMSHEIRTPMNAIIGFSNILAEDDNTEEEQSQYISIIKNSCDNLLQIINDILDFSKIEAGKLEVEMAECSLDEVLTQAKSLVALKALEKHVDFKINKSEDVPDQIYTDAGRLSQCLINLANNAVKFTEKGHVHINVYLENGDDGKEYIRFDVKDTGIGIKPEDQRKVFDSFSQADYSSTRKYGGTGLGLAITKKLTELLGGELRLTSEEGEGSVFSMTIPVEVEGADRPGLDKSVVGRG